jgi:cholesterol oxidase
MGAPEFFETVVVGSGFGGSVVAYRLAEAGKQVLVLERGQAYKPGEFTRTIPGVGDSFWDPSNQLYGRFNVWFFKKLGALVSSGLGGGSLIYANVLVRKPAEWFDADERWPISYRELDRHYKAVEDVIDPRPYPTGDPYDRVQKIRAFRDAARKLASRDTSLRVLEDPNLAIKFSAAGEPLGVSLGSDNLHGVERRTCTLCGDCVAGCNVGAKSTLDFNYLSLAKKYDAEIRPLTEVRAFRPRRGGGIELDYVTHDPQSRSTSAINTLHCQRLVLAAGTFGSTYLMMKNANSFGSIPALGTRFSGNGDQLAFAVDCKPEINAMFGPNITSVLRGEDALDPGSTSSGRGFYLEDAGFPHELGWMVEGFRAGGFIARFIRFFRQMARKMWFWDRDPDLGAELRALLGDARLSSHFLPLLAMGRDYPDGTFSLTERDDPDDTQYLALDWNGTRSSDYFERVTNVQRALAEELGGKFVRNLPSLLSRTITVHPLGGCPMGDDPTTSVVDSYGRVRVPDVDLHIVDGSIIPASVGPNPSLTIAAIANRAADRMLG